MKNRQGQLSHATGHLDGQTQPTKQSMKPTFLLFVALTILASSYLFGVIPLHLKPNTQAHPGDCAAIGPRRPPFDDRYAFIQAIPTFRHVYDQRLIRENVNGMRFVHSFALWYILRALQPTPSVVIESGADRGHSTWVIRQALPDTRIISISPRPPDNFLDGVEYYIKENFTDFGQIDWDALMKRNERQNALFFFDDHQSAFRRIFEEGAPLGFRRFVQEDNYRYLRGDALSMKWLCEVDRRERWRGVVTDDFARKRVNQTWDQHMKQTEILRHRVKFYYEFPPILSQNVSNATMYDDAEAAPPLLEDEKVAKKLVGREYVDELKFYQHISYVELFELDYTNNTNV